MTTHKNTILVIGKPGSGKKTFFKHTEPDYKKTSNNTFSSFENSNTRFIIPNTPLEKDSSATFFDTMKSHYPAQPFQLLILLVDFPTLFDKTKITDTQKFFKDQLQLIQGHQKKLHFVIVFTKCDRLLGFQEFFNQLTLEERKQTLGIDNKKTFEDLIKTINQQVITRLHQESLPEKRAFIQMFPAQFEKALTLATDFMKGLTQDTAIQKDGVYFTSNKQKHKPIDILTNHKNTLPPSITDKIFFKENLLHELNHFASLHKIKTKQTDKKRWAIIPISLALIITLLLTWHTSYQNTAHILKTVQTTLQQTVTPVDDEPFWLARLNVTASALQQLDTSKIKYSSLVGFGQANALRQKLNLIYKTQLKIRFLPHIEGILTTTMSNSMAQNKLQLYNTLKIYLMLAADNHYDANTIINWFALYWQHKYPKSDALQKTLLYNLRQLLSMSNSNWPRNNALIQQSQLALRALPPADIVFLELQGIYKNQQKSLASMLDNQSDFDLSKAIIPALFSSNNFKTIYNDTIPKLVKKLNTFNWVIGKTTPKEPDIKKQAELISEVRALYLTYFSENWSHVLSHITLKKVDNLADIQNIIEDLKNKQSAPMNLLRVIIGNATLDKKLQPSDNINNANQFVSGGANYQQTNTLLSVLSLYLKPIAAADNPQKASYNLTLSMLEKSSKNPIQTLLALPNTKSTLTHTWLKSIATSSLQIILNNTKAHLNTLWHQNAFSVYKDNIKDNYPIFQTSDDEISLKNFNAFFGPNGTLDLFFNYYLKPFVDMQSSYWTWRTLYGIKIPMPQSALDMFMRASLIQRMFYTDNRNAPSFKFTLTPAAKSSNVASAIISINGQTQTATNQAYNNSNFVWPGSTPGSASITLHLNKADSLTHPFSGDWAALRLLDFAQVAITKNPAHYVITFKFNKNYVTYHLGMDNKVNPLLPGVMNQFRAQDTPF